MRISHVASGIESQKLNRYKLGQEVGYGPGTIIYLAVDSQTGREVALKVIDTSMYPVSGKEKLMKEVIYHQMVSGHPSIVTIHDHFKMGNHIYIVMDYAPKGDLFKLIKLRREVLSDHQKRKLMYQICSAIEFMHSKNLIHRDIKPENILLDNQLNSKLCDFGWACHLDDVKSRYANAGTFEYMSPECLRQEIQNKPTDIWSLGILVYELYHGKEPFSGSSKDQILDSIYNGKAVFTSDCPDSAVEVFEQCVRYEPGNRITIEQLLQHSFFDPIRDEVKSMARSNENARQNLVRASSHISHSVGHKRPYFFENNSSHNSHLNQQKEVSRVISQSSIIAPSNQVTTSHLQLGTRPALIENRVILNQQPQAKPPLVQKLVQVLHHTDPPLRSLSAGLTRPTVPSHVIMHPQSTWMPAHQSGVIGGKFKSARPDIEHQDITPQRWGNILPFKTLSDKPFKSFTTNHFFTPPSQTLLRPFNPPASQEVIYNVAYSQTAVQSPDILSGSQSPVKSERMPLRLKKSVTGREDGKRGSAMQMLEAPRFSRGHLAMPTPIQKPIDTSPTLLSSSYAPHHQNYTQDKWAQSNLVQTKSNPVAVDRRAKAPVKAIRMVDNRGQHRSFHDESTIDRVDQRVIRVYLAF